MKLPRLHSLVFLVVFVAAPAASPHARSASETTQATYRILVTNDDGVRAPGILAVAQALKAIGEVTIVAPADNQSGKAHSITSTDPVYVDPVALPGGLAALAATATPASCVRIALGALLKERPDLVVSGINRGYNFGMNAYLSGTVGAAREGALRGIPAIASSMDSAGGNDYAAAAKATADLAAMVKAHGLPAGVFLNVNVPAGVPKGVRLATQSRLLTEETWVEHKTPRGRRYFWSDFQDSARDVDGTDIAVATAGYVAVVTLKASEYDAAAADKLRNVIK